MIDRRKRAALRTRRLHELLEREESGAEGLVRMDQGRANLMQEMAERLAERLASRKPFRSPGKELLADYRSME